MASVLVSGTLYSSFSVHVPHLNLLDASVNEKSAEALFMSFQHVKVAEKESEEVQDLGKEEGLEPAAVPNTLKGWYYPSLSGRRHSVNTRTLFSSPAPWQCGHK